MILMMDAEIKRHYVIPLVRSQKGLPVVGKIPDQGRGQKGIISKIDDSIGKTCGRENNRQETGKRYSSRNDYPPYPPVHVSQHGDNFINPGFIMFKNRLVKHIPDSRAYAKFRQIEEIQQTH